MDTTLLKYALALDENNRILSVTYEQYATDEMIVVDSLPDGIAEDYKYVDGSYVYDPLSTSAVVSDEDEPTAEEDALGMLLDHELRILELELGITEE